MRLEALGSGCANCEKLYALVTEVVRELGIADAEVVKVQDLPTIARYGVMSTPALAIDGRVVLGGRVPGRAEVVSAVTTALAERG